MKVGDIVVCIRVDDILEHNGEIIDSPKIGDEVIINRVWYDGYISFIGYDEYTSYDSTCFRKRALTNKVTRKLVNDFIEVEERIEKPQKVEI